MFYKLDSRKVTFQEYRYGSSWPAAALAWLTRYLGIGLPGSSDDPAVESLRPFEVPMEQWPAGVRAQFEPAAEALRARGFAVDGVGHAIYDPTKLTRIYLLNVVHPSGTAFARLHHRVWEIPQPARQCFFPMFISAFEDGTFLVSSAGKPDLLAPPTCTMNRVVGASAAELWDSHQRALDQLCATKRVIGITDADQLRMVMDVYQDELRNFHVQRGVFVPMTDVEQVQDAAGGESLAGRHAAALAEIERLQQARTSWGNAALLLGISLLAFLGAGAASWSPRIVLLMIPILLFHELGHFLAMRLFRYCNVRMFFIPFLGAAVSGRHYNVPAWKKAVVSLLGPLPGILVGAGLGFAALWYHNKLLLELAALTVFVNGFNLLPILPLDGGWVVHAILFSRHYLLDFGFRLVAAGLLIVSGGLIHDWVLFGLGMMMLLGLPLSYRLGKITSCLRARLAVTSPDDQTIPVETACTILDELKPALGKSANARTQATCTLQVFESLNTRPPGWLGTLALAGIHAGGFVVAAVLFATFVVAQHTNLRDFLRQAAAMPPNQLECGTIRTWRGPVAPDAQAATPVTLCANFPDPAAASTTFQELVGQAPPAVAVVLLGQTILLEVPVGDERARRQWTECLEARCEDVGMHDADVGLPLVLVCLAPNAAVAASITAEANAYMRIPPGCHVIPPWSREVALTEAQRKARRTVLQIQEASQKQSADPELTKITKELIAASSRADKQALAEGMRRRQARLAELEAQQLEQLRSEGAHQVNVQVVDLYAARPGKGAEVDEAEDNDQLVKEQYRHWCEELGQLLGPVPLVEGRPAPGADRFSTHSGLVRQSGLLLRFNWMSFVRPAVGAPALIDWLCDQQCRNFKYQFETGRAPEDE